MHIVVRFGICVGQQAAILQASIDHIYRTLNEEPRSVQTPHRFRSLLMKQVLAWVLTALLVAPQLLIAAEQSNGARSFKQVIIEDGGWPMKVILALSIFMTFLVIYFLFSLRQSVLFPRAFVREIEAAAQEGDIEALVAICHGNESATALVVRAAAEQFVGSNNVDYAVLRDAIEDEGARQAGFLWQRIQYLMDVAIIAPMVGLLGTVLGMLQSFSGLQTELGAVRPEALAQGVSKALVTTAGGLVVGITAMVLYAIFRGRVSSLIAGLENVCNRVIRNLLVRRSALDPAKQVQ